MQVGQLFPCRRKPTKFRREGDAREFFLEVIGEAFAVGGVVEQGIDVVENVPFGDAVVDVVRAELCQRPIGDVFAPVRTVLIVGVVVCLK